LFIPALTGCGRSVTLDEIGHLSDVIQHYSYAVEGGGVLRRLAGQIASAARRGETVYPFRSNYQFRPIQYAHGRATVSGQFSGRIGRDANMLTVQGPVRFMFYDRFTDPISVRSLAKLVAENLNAVIDRARSSGIDVENDVAALDQMPDVRPSITNNEDPIVRAIVVWLTELGETAFDLHGAWQAYFNARVLVDGSRSAYRSSFAN
jgi:hypothetical protein